MRPGSPKRYDYEYTRKEKANIFIAVDPKRGRRIAKVIGRRTKKDFALFVMDILKAYPWARKLHLVVNNLNTHLPKSTIETFDEEEGRNMLSRIAFNHTSKHGSWLNIAEIEINVMDIECTKRRFESYEELDSNVKVWTKRRNRQRTKIKWEFTREKADAKLSKYYAV